MDSNTTSLLLSSPLATPNRMGSTFIDSSILKKQTNVPEQFVWPEEDLVGATQELMEPVVDLEGFLGGDEEATQKAATMVRDACLKHGFFQVINHGVDLNLVGLAHEHMNYIFKRPSEQKKPATLVEGSRWGFSGSHADRFNSKLPWKETFSFGYQENSTPEVEGFFVSALGKDSEQTW